MKDYEVSFVIKGKPYREVVTASNSYQARKIMEMRYDGIKIMSIREV